MAKLMCAKCGGKVKMANGGTTPKKVLAKAPVNMYGIPQENMGTSSQYGFGKKGGTVKKMQDGGMPGRILKKMKPDLKYKDRDPGFSITPKNPYKNMDPGFTKTPSKPYRNMDPGFFKTPKINSGNKDVFKNAGPAPQPKGYKRGGLTKRK